MRSFILYINNSKCNLLFIKSFYYTKWVSRNHKLAIKYLERKNEYNYNIKQFLNIIKIIINIDNINCFKNKIIATLL